MVSTTVFGAVGPGSNPGKTTKGDYQVKQYYFINDGG